MGETMKEYTFQFIRSYVAENEEKAREQLDCDFVLNGTSEVDLIQINEVKQ